jgi:hypothetical protein
MHPVSVTTDTPGISRIRYIHCCLFVLTTRAYIHSIYFQFGKERKHGRQYLNFEIYIPFRWQTNMNKVLLGAFAYFAKKPITFAMSVRMYQLDSHQTDLRKI